MPGMKDYISTVKDGKRSQKQKRLLLFNLIDLHKQFSEKFPYMSICLAKFRQLRPRECILAEEERKPDEDIILSLVNNKLDIKCVSEEFRDIYRVGKKVTEKSRPIAIELTHYKLKLNILKAANKLKDTKIFVSQDYTQEDYQKNKLLYKYKKRALAENSEAYIKNNNLFINGEIVTYEQLLEKENLSEELEESEAEEVEVSAGNSKIVNNKNSKRKENPSIEEETDNKSKKPNRGRPAAKK
ncbi:unnamed protein product [Brassicogethes aeneus]|uniref:Uncharacterized protein n=1 Tax=Brassicogethes aeneus TaxID=1431903 RepID=A0A9P0FFZ7_BRAAE|nr:unnamed protein product [Brassicogethes aeneus]